MPADLPGIEPSILRRPGEPPWLGALRPPTDSRRLLAPRSAWAILALASGDARFAARVADGLDAPEASRARRRLEAHRLIALLPLLAGRAGRAWCSVAHQAALARLLDDPRVLSSVDAEDPARRLQGYVRASDLPALVDAHGLHAPPEIPPAHSAGQSCCDRWPIRGRFPTAQRRLPDSSRPSTCSSWSPRGIPSTYPMCGPPGR